jgi:predicted nucleic acid-binding protein
VRPAALLDASVLYSATMRSVLLYLGRFGLFRPLWSEAIEEEWTRAVLRRQQDGAASRLRRACHLMNHELPSARIVGFAPLVPALTLPDPDDRHVLAAAIHGAAQFIVTMNLRDFPKRVLGLHGVAGVHPDRFALSLIEQDAGIALRAFAADRARMAGPPLDRDAYLALVGRAGLRRTAKALALHADLL